jgi:hypothetical protein
MRTIEMVRTGKKSIGRPVKIIKKEIRAAIRFSKNEYFILKEKAAKAGVNTSEYIRQTAIYSTIKSRLTEEERQIVKVLVGMSNNLNQIAKACHQQNMLSALYQFQAELKQLDAILKKLKND